ncbi:MAG: AAA family ATPase [Pseudomonadota bacterium]
MTQARAVRDARRLVHALKEHGAFGHPVGDIALLETHISWVLLTGEFAYKIKKPVKLEFLDFSTLADRKRCCDDELRLNRRWAPSLYLDVVAITGEPHAPAIGGSGSVLEYALRMRQFPQAARLDAQVEAGNVQGPDFVALAEDIAARHLAAPATAPHSRAEAVASVARPVMENFDYLQGIVGDGDLNALRLWTSRNLAALEAVLADRQRKGFVRECHGDLHLGNLVRLEDGIQAFDCIEFSKALRSIDVISDVAFLVMDLAARSHEDLASVFLNRYLEVTGDYGGLQVFGLYYVYHCLIRAKVAAIRSRERDDPSAAEADAAAACHYAAVAQRWIDSEAPTLVAMHGFSASGKSWLSGQLMAALPAIRMRSDCERKRLHGLAETESSASAVGEDLYTDAARGDVYEHLFTLAATVLKAGHSVILDGSFLEAGHRAQARKLAAACGAGFAIVSASASDAVLEQRLRARAGDASEADVAVLAWQRRHADSLTQNERALSVVVDTEKVPPLAQITAQIGRLAP